MRQGSGALAILCTIGVVVRAQDVPPGMVARFDVTQRLEYSDNPDFDVDGESDFYGRTVLGFSLESLTKVERFSFGLGTDVEEGRNDQSGLDWKNSNARLDYVRNTRNALLGLNASYRESDVESDISDEDFDEDGRVITQDNGKRRSYRFGLEGAIGREAPVGASFAWNYDKLTYSDTDDPDLTDRIRNDVRGQVDFRVSPRITTNLTGKYIDFDAQGNGVDRKTTGLGAGAVLEIDRVRSANLSLSYDRIKRSGDETGTDKGISLVTGLTQAVPDGSWGVRFETDVASNDNGRRSYLAVSRDMELPRGNLSYSLGLTGAGSVIGLDPLVNFDYTHIRPTQRISIGLSQRVVTDNENREDINTTLRAGFNQQINNVSSYGINMSFFNRNDLDDGGDDGRRFDISLSYRHDLTRDWGLVSGISHAYSDEDDGDDRRRTTIFVGLQRSFSWSP